MSDADKASVSQRYCSLEPQLKLGKDAFARASEASQGAESLQPVLFSINWVEKCQPQRLCGESFVEAAERQDALAAKVLIIFLAV